MLILTRWKIEEVYSHRRVGFHWKFYRSQRDTIEKHEHFSHTATSRDTNSWLGIRGGSISNRVRWEQTVAARVTGDIALFFPLDSSTEVPRPYRHSTILKSEKLVAVSMCTNHESSSHQRYCLRQNLEDHTDFRFGLEPQHRPWNPQSTMKEELTSFSPTPTPQECWD